LPFHACAAPRRPLPPSRGAVAGRITYGRKQAQGPSCAYAQRPRAGRLRAAPARAARLARHGGSGSPPAPRPSQVCLDAQVRLFRRGVSAAAVNRRCVRRRARTIHRARSSPDAVAAASRTRMVASQQERPITEGTDVGGHRHRRARRPRPLPSVGSDGGCAVAHPPASRASSRLAAESPGKGGSTQLLTAGPRSWWRSSCEVGRSWSAAIRLRATAPSESVGSVRLSRYSCNDPDS